jgi:mitochondrial import inner membrane translocase subunit TIM50
MLARLALQAPRLGFTAARLATSARPVARVAPIAASHWARTYAKSKGNPNRPPVNPNNSNAPKQPSPNESVPEGSSSPANASSAESETAAAKDSSKAAEANADEPHIPFDKLPDLTQGIPSTLDAEIEQKYGKTRDPSALQTVDDQGSGRGRGGREEYVSSSERNRKWWARFFLAAVGGGSVVGIAYLGRNWESEEEAKKHPEIPNGWSPILWYQRVKARFDESVSYYQEPAFEKLLPDPDPVYGRPYTLVLSLDDLLIHSEWTREHGWRVAKRPGVDYFIRYLHLYYELALFTTVPYAMAEGVLRKLDPHHFIQYPMFREATKFEDGEIVKVGPVTSTQMI